MLRTFIAVGIAGHMREAVAELIERMKTSGADVKWVRPENLHLTLKFLGNVQEQKVEDIARGISSGSEGTAPFEISLKGVGAFPNARRPRVVWVGVEEGSDQLVSLSKEIEDRLATLGFEKERRKFSPHLTIGRMRRDGRPGDLADKLSLQFEGGSCEVDRVLLMKSTLTPRGAVYDELRHVVLKEKS